ncbi:hypothetical protein DHEL01_v206249 [Diaporthe helianthi]|uniref:Carbohydrate kinase PfkB domain-containing protein n=1 Tax=Diaporthe helianthi TaxID=158607 RepID=A0A2P5HYM7_DIAHE|nr:hypothetical protein DHEL01_v206249 [Diaporthe helianthi]
MNQHFATANLVDVYSPNHLEFLALFEDSKFTTRDGKVDSGLLKNHTEKLLESGIGPDGKGAVVSSNSMPGRHHWLPAFFDDDAAIIDATGAGNTFLGALTFAMSACRHDIVEASAMASVAARFSLQQMGLPNMSSGSEPPIISAIDIVRNQLNICSSYPGFYSYFRHYYTTFDTMPVYQVNMQKVCEREDMEDGYIYLERVPYKPKQGNAGRNDSPVKSSHTTPAPPAPKVLPDSIASKPNNQATPVTNSSHRSPQQTSFHLALAGIRNHITQVFTCQTIMAIFEMVHEVAFKVIKAGRTVTSSGGDDAGISIHGVPTPGTHQKDTTLVMNRSPGNDLISTNTRKLGSHEEDDFVVLDNNLRDPRHEDDFFMVDVSSADKDNDFIMVDAVPWADPSPLHLLGRTSGRFLVHSRLF